MNYTYIVECSDGTFYTGWTTNIENRIATHNAGKGAKYTRGKRPVKLVYYHEYETKSEAMSAEFLIKRFRRHEKLELINSKMNQLKGEDNYE